MDTKNNSCCIHCDSQPCYWDQHKEAILCAVEVLFLDQVDNALLHPNQCRKMCYREFARKIHGCLGTGIGVELPRCIVEKVREKFPNDGDVEYMGFREE